MECKRCKKGAKFRLAVILFTLLIVLSMLFATDIFVWKAYTSKSLGYRSVQMEAPNYNPSWDPGPTLITMSPRKHGLQKQRLSLTSSAIRKRQRCHKTYQGIEKSAKQNQFQVVDKGSCYVYSAFVDPRFGLYGNIRITGLLLHTLDKQVDLLCQLWYSNFTNPVLVPVKVLSAKSLDTEER